MAKEKQMPCITVAEPAALGLFGLAIATLVASTQKLGLTTGVSLVLPWILFLGAFAQLFAAIADSKRNNIFGTTAFGGYSFFWMGVALTWLIKSGALGADLMNSVDIKQLGVAFIGYLVFSLYMTVVAMEINKVLFIILILIDVLFTGLAFATFGIVPEIFTPIAGVSEMAIAIMSFYGSAAVILNVHMGRVVLPLGSPLGVLKPIKGRQRSK